MIKLPHAFVEYLSQEEVISSLLIIIYISSNSGIYILYIQNGLVLPKSFQKSFQFSGAEEREGKFDAQIPPELHEQTASSSSSSLSPVTTSSTPEPVRNQFTALYQEIDEAILRLGGRVFIKLNW